MSGARAPTSAEIIDAFVRRESGRGRRVTFGQRNKDGGYVCVWGPSATVGERESWFFELHRDPDGAVSFPKDVAVPGKEARNPVPDGRFKDWVTPTSIQHQGWDADRLVEVLIGALPSTVTW